MKGGSSEYLKRDPLFVPASPYVDILILQRGLSVSVIGFQKAYQRPAALGCTDIWDCVIITID